jgi:4-hydroxy-tetrahydrodipicolinate reductase
MSKRIISLMAKDKSIEAVYGVEKKGHQDIGRTLSETTGVEAENLNSKIADNIEDSVADADVIVEFTNPQTTLEHLQVAEKNKKAMVIGTTGLSKEQVSEIEKAASSIAVFFSPNMSLGVNVVLDLIEKLAESLSSEYNVEIIETHHKNKEDAPSGTAKKMAQIIAKARDLDPEKDIIYSRAGRVGRRPDAQIAVHAVRGGSVVGIHEIRFISKEDEISITHQAFSRDIFAKGAISACKFINDKEKGLFSTEDLL